jgi:hypothetical protein
MKVDISVLSNLIKWVVNSLQHGLSLTNFHSSCAHDYGCVLHAIMVKVK